MQSGHTGEEMSSDLHFSIETPSLDLIYNVLDSQPVPRGVGHYFTVQQVDKCDSEEEICSGPPGIQMRAKLHVAPFAPDWERMELWGRNCGRGGDGGPEIAIEDLYGFEILQDFAPCKVYVPHTSDKNVYENKMIWFDFPCPRPDGAPIYADQVVFLFGAKCRESAQ